MIADTVVRLYKHFLHNEELKKHYTSWLHINSVTETTKLHKNSNTTGYLRYHWPRAKWNGICLVLFGSLCLFVRQ